jgi:F-type H+-transporting ATPase subunit delta
MAGRYATALFELALESDALESVESDIDAFQTMLDESQDLRRLVRSPVFSADEQRRALAAVLGRAGVSGLTENFFGLIARNRRLFAVHDIIAAFRALLAGHRGEVTAEIVSAAPLSDGQVNAIRSALSDADGREVRVATSVDGTLLGGLIVRVGSRMFDNSLRTKLNKLKIAMKEVG